MLVLVCLIYKGEIQTLPSPTFAALGSQEWGSVDFQNCPREAYALVSYNWVSYLAPICNSSSINFIASLFRKSICLTYVQNCDSGS